MGLSNPARSTLLGADAPSSRALGIIETHKVNHDDKVRYKVRVEGGECGGTGCVLMPVK